jgi:hypothetical protein
MGMLKFEDDWFEQTPYLRKLNSIGYTVNRVDDKYILYEMKNLKVKVLAEYQTQEELENMCKLLLPEGEQGE